MISRNTLCTVLLSSTVLCSAYQWPDPQYEALERLLYEGTDINNLPTSILTNSCGRRVTNGSPVAAEWLRLSYHDAATHNITDGTGGTDASIYYELDRAENIGAGMLSSMNDFSASSNKYVSRADLVALGVVWGVASCGGPILPFRGGRTDALAAGRLGVPQPQETLDIQTERFRLQGFNATEMISLVACGHTLGGVRNVDFPNIVPGNGTLMKFDGTDAYDDTIVAEYLNGTTIDPMITVSNLTLQSDQRIFASDGNATMKNMNSPSAFNATCAALLERVIHLVPSTVTLTDEIALLPFKVHDARLTIQNSELVFVVEVRVAVTAALQSAGLTPTAIALFWCDSRGSAAGCPDNTASTTVVTHPAAFNDALVSPVAVALQTSFVSYEFVVPIDPGRGIQRFWFEVLNAQSAGGAGGTREDNGGAGYIVDDAIMFVDELGSAVQSTAAGGGVTFNVIAGVLAPSSSPPTVASMSVLDNTFLGTPSTPFNASFALRPATNASLPVITGYTLYAGTFTTPNNTAGHPTLDLFFTFSDSGGNSDTLAMDFVRPTGPKDFFAPESIAPVSTTTVSTVPTVVTAIVSSTGSGAGATGAAPQPTGKTSAGHGAGSVLGDRWGLVWAAGLALLWTL